MADFPLDSKPTIWPGGLSVTVPPPIKLDASIREEHAAEFQITSSPIEGGGTVTDHILEVPTRLTMDVVITRTPDSVIPNVQRTRHLRVFRQILALARLRKPFDVQTTLATYPGMVVQRVGTSRVDARGFLVVTLDLRRIEIATVDVAQVQADAASEIALGEQDLGAVSSAAETASPL